jgi:hypothetical protein
MKNKYFITILTFPFIIYADTVVFNKTFGGSENDFAYSIQQTTDGGYIVAGQTDSYGNGGLLKPDVWVVKLDKTGNKEWDKTFGGKEGDGALSIQQTTEGYIVAGTTSSYGKGYPSIWIIKLDPNGDSIWTKVHEGTIVSSAHSIQQTMDGGYIVAGKGKENILKLDNNGNLEWGKHYSWIFYSVMQTSDGGYIVVGDSIYHQLEWDYIPSLSIFKLDENGNKEWYNPLSDDFVGSAKSVQQTSDGGYIIAGDSIYFKSEFERSHYLMVVKLDENGNKEWNYFGSEFSGAESIQQTADYGYIIAGNTIDDEYGLDFLIIKLDENGNEKWIKTYGSTGGWEYASSIQQTSEGGYIVAGQTDYYGSGKYDMWILKLDENGNGPGSVGFYNSYYDFNEFLILQNYPNPFNQSTTIYFMLPISGFVTLTVINNLGIEIETIADGYCTTGEYTLEWTSKNLSSGVYYYRLQIGQFVKTKRFILQK